MEDESVSERNRGLDQAKGVAAILVVLSHITVSEIQQNPFLNNALGIFWLFFHNPTFYYISGMLFYGSLKRQKVRLVLRRKYFDTVVLYVLWTAIFFLLHVAFEYTKNSLSVMALEAVNHLWFFPTLFAGYAMIVAARHFSRTWILAAAWIGLYVGVGFISTPVSKVFLYSFLMWMGYYDAQKASKIGILRNSAGGFIVRLVFLAVCIIGMNVSGYFVVGKVLSSPGIGYVLLHLPILMSCKVLADLFTYETIQNGLEKKSLRWIRNSLTILGQSSAYLYVLQVIPLIIYQNQGDHHFPAAFLCFAACIVFPLGVKWGGEHFHLRLIQGLLKPSFFFRFSKG